MDHGNSRCTRWTPVIYRMFDSGYKNKRKLTEVEKVISIILKEIKWIMYYPEATEDH